MKFKKKKILSNIKSYYSGGVCLRKKFGMNEFRGSMAGAAAIVAAIRSAAALSLPINISAVIPLCEHLPSGMSVKPGDVITCLNGKSLAIRVSLIHNDPFVSKS